MPFRPGVTQEHPVDKQDTKTEKRLNADEQHALDCIQGTAPAVENAQKRADEVLVAVAQVEATRDPCSIPLVIPARELRIALARARDLSRHLENAITSTGRHAGRLATGAVMERELLDDCEQKAQAYQDIGRTNGPFRR